jgi:hypothetical protein
MVYARVHDQTVADDYYAAITATEQRLQLSLAPVSAEVEISPAARTKLLELVSASAEPELSVERRLDCVS